MATRTNNTTWPAENKAKTELAAEADTFSLRIYKKKGNKNQWPLTKKSLEKNKE
jgi:hypothetical protein